MSRGPTTHVTLLTRLGDSGDTLAWREFCRRYGELICGFARRRGLQPADCDDILQDVLTALARNMPNFRYDPRRGSFRGYLKTVTDRAISRRFRQKQTTAPQSPYERASAMEQEALADQLWEEEWRQYHLRQAMKAIEAEFSPAVRGAFEAYAVQGRAVADVAATLDMTVDQVYQAKSRVTRRLTELIEQQVAEEG